MNRFKPGDKARVIGGGYPWLIGHEGKIDAVIQHPDKGIYYRVRKNKNEYGFVCDCDLEPIEPGKHELDLEPIEPVQEEESPWISVDDRLPEIKDGRYSERVLCYTKSGLMTVGFILNGEWYYDARSETFERWGHTVTDWTFLPKPPISRLKSEIEELKNKKP